MRKSERGLFRCQILFGVVIILLATGILVSYIISRHPNAERVSVDEYMTDKQSNKISVADVIEKELWSKYIATKHTNSFNSKQGESGGEWTWCTHLIKYGPNFDRGLANFIGGILRPRSMIEFGCGIGLYINYVERYTSAKYKDSSRFIGIEPESMMEAGVFGVDPYKAKQLQMNIFDVEQDVLNSLGTFDVVFSSEVAEHIPLKNHDQMYDFLVSKTDKFLVFGAARRNQGGTGHLRESMHDMEYWIKKFEDKGMIHLVTLSKRLRASCYNTWDKGQNTFIMVHKEFHQSYNLDEVFGGLNDVSNIFPKFHSKYTNIKKQQTCV